MNTPISIDNPRLQNSESLFSEIGPRAEVLTSEPPIETPDPNYSRATQPLPDGKLYICADNGFTAGLAALLPDGQVIVRAVPVDDLGKHRLLAISETLKMLEDILQIACVPKARTLVVFEQSPITPLFGAKNNFINGQNNEFWRVLLTLTKFPFTWVNPKVWQKHVFQGVRGTDTKAMANLVRKQRFPTLDLSDFNSTQREGINDALCIGLWARDNRK